MRRIAAGSSCRLRSQQQRRDAAHLRGGERGARLQLVALVRRRREDRDAGRRDRDVRAAVRLRRTACRRRRSPSRRSRPDRRRDTAGATADRHCRRPRSARRLSCASAAILSCISGSDGPAKLMLITSAPDVPAYSRPGEDRHARPFRAERRERRDRQHLHGRRDAHQLAVRRDHARDAGPVRMRLVGLADRVERRRDRRRRDRDAACRSSCRSRRREYCSPFTSACASGRRILPSAYWSGSARCAEAPCSSE